MREVLSECVVDVLNDALLLGVEDLDGVRGWVTVFSMVVVSVNSKESENDGVSVNVGEMDCDDSCEGDQEKDSLAVVENVIENVGKSVLVTVPSEENEVLAESVRE